MRNEETISASRSTEPTPEEWAELFRLWEEMGVLVSAPPADPPDPNFKPIAIEGEPLSETIIRERR